VFQTKKNKNRSYISFVYIGMGTVYILAGTTKHSLHFLPYAALLLQITLGFLQGYFRAWHIKQETYRFDAVTHYLIVGIAMFGLSFAKIISPAVFLTAFGSILCICGFWSVLIRWRASRPQL